MNNKKYIKAKLILFPIAAMTSSVMASTLVTKNIELDGWIGATDTQVLYSGDTSGVDVIISSDQNCDPDNYTACNNSSFNNLGFSFWPRSRDLTTDTATTATQTGYYQFIDGSTILETSLSANNPGTVPTGLGMAASYQFGSIVTGGEATGLPNDTRVWINEFEKGWTAIEQNENSEFTPRAYHQMTPYYANFSIFSSFVITGGANLSESDPTVLISAPGAPQYWTAETDTNLTKAEHHQMVLFNGGLFIIGGSTTISDSEVPSGVLESSNASDWYEVASNVSFKDLVGHRSIVFNDRIWLIGGNQAGGSSSIWSSPDGHNWNIEAQEAPFGSRSDFGITQVDGELILSGGKDESGIPQNDIWTSTDGKQWTKSNSSLPKPLSGHLAIEESNNSSDSAIKLFSGVTSSEGTLFNSVYRSSADNYSYANSEWREYANSSVTMDVLVHTVKATNVNDGLVVAEKQISDTDEVRLYLGTQGEQNVLSVDSSCPGELIGNTFEITSVTKDCSLLVTYDAVTYQVTATATGKGIITPASATVEANNTISLTVTPDSWWYVIDSVEGCGGSLTSANIFTTAPVISDCSVTATFAPWWSTWFR
jgi:hypothetical protein